jgi:hypothetical protein
MQTGQFFQGMDARQDATYQDNINSSTPTWTDFEECQTYILMNGLTLCEVFTIPA